MAANMQHMAGAAGMMQQQRPRPSPIQLNQFLYQTMLAQQQIHSGWQAGVAIQERMIKCHNLYVALPSLPCLAHSPSRFFAPRLARSPLCQAPWLTCCYLESPTSDSQSPT